MSESGGGTAPRRHAGLPRGFWVKLGLTPQAEIRAGHQSRVFRASDGHGPLIVKLVEVGSGCPGSNPAANEDVHRRRVELARRVAAINPAVVGPVELDSNLITVVDGWRVVCYPFVEGRPPDSGDRSDVEMMASTLAALHDSLAMLTESSSTLSLPPVTALGGETPGALGRRRVIHGDYAAANLIVTPSEVVTTSQLRVVDFDDCGYGSVEFEIGNSLYMELFDAWNTGRPDRYRCFRRWFVDTYRIAAAAEVNDEALDRAVAVRVIALRRWLDDPAAAPTGIRNESKSWRRRLRSFVDQMAANDGQASPWSSDTVGLCESE